MLRRHRPSMDRPSPVRFDPRHRCLVLEQLEDRRVLSAILMTGYEQLLLELVNRARNDPSAEATRFQVDLNAGLNPGTITTDAKQPLAPHQSLVTAAGLHAQDMLDNEFFEHNNLQGETPSDRARTAGYLANVGENIAWSGTSGFLDQTAQVFARHEALFLSETHRQNMMLPSYREAGIGVRFGEFESFNAIMVAEEFGNQGGRRFITGVAIDDLRMADDFYSIGEGLGDLSITAVDQSTGATFTTTTGPTGGYSLQVPGGVYSVRAAGSAISGQIDVENVSLGSANVKVDFNSRTMSPVPTDLGPVTATVVGQTQVDLSWTDVAGESAYWVYQWLGGSARFVVATAANETSFSVDGLSPGSSQNFLVQAVNSSGRSSSGWTRVTLPSTTPPPPENFTVSALSATQVQLSWTDSDIESGYRVYEYRDGHAVFVAGLGSNVTSYTASNLTPGSRHHFLVQAFNASGTAGTSWQSITLPSSSLPTQPTSVAATALSSTSLEVTWADSSGETSYRVYRWNGSTRYLGSFGADTTRFVYNGYAGESGVHLLVQAVNGLGVVSSGWQFISLETQTPMPPGDFQLTSNSPGEVQFTWNDSDRETGYYVYQWQGGARYLTTLPAGSTSYVVTNLGSGTQHLFLINAFNSQGSSSTGWHRITTLAAAADEAPSLEALLESAAGESKASESEDVELIAAKEDDEADAEAVAALRRRAVDAVYDDEQHWQAAAVLQRRA